MMNRQRGITEHQKALLDKLPKPTGFRLLIAIPKKEEKSEGGIILPGQEIKREQTASLVGYVMAVGDLAYKNVAGVVRFPNGPWCEPGDYIMFKTYSGVRFSVEGQEFRLINDDTVEAVVPNPDLIERL